MREIKFRAYNKKTGRMFNGFAIDSYARNILFVRKSIGQTFSPHPDITMDDVVLMQFTGLRDKNAKEIYEGDIIKGTVGYPGKGWVEWMGFNQMNTWIGTWIVWDSIVRDECSALFPNQDIEVISNIYEHPELLENK